MSALTSTRALRALVNEIETNAPMAVEAYTAHASVREASRKLEGELLAAILAELARSSAIRALAGPKDWADIISMAESAIRGSKGSIGLAVDLSGHLHTCVADGISVMGTPAVHLEFIQPETAAERFGLQTILDAIADRLDVAINSHPKSAVKVKRHVEIVHACLVLLRKGREPGGGP